MPADPLRLRIRGTASLGINDILDQILDRAERASEDVRELNERLCVAERDLNDERSAVRALRSNVRELAKIVLRSYDDPEVVGLRTDIPLTLKVMIEELLNG